MATVELLRFCLGTLSILLTQVLLAAALSGIGLLVRRGFGPRGIRLDDCFLAFWIGLACVTLFLLVWNFFLPVGGLALPIVLAAGAAGLLGVRHELTRMFANDPWRPSPGVVVLLVLVALWVANMCLGPLDNPDSALYHIQAVRWAEHHPAIPGIANLNGPFAFNNSSLLFDALLSAGPWQDRANHLANGLLIQVFLLQSVVAGARLAAGDRQPRRLFDLFLVAPAASLALHGQISSFVTDIAPTLVVMVAASLLYARLSAETRDKWEDSYGLVAFGTLLALAVSFKLNAAVFAATGFLLAIFLWRRGKQPADGLLIRTMGWASAAITLIAAAWMGRGIVLSGYPLFPTPVAGFPVEWRAPVEHATAEFAFIVHSGRASTRNPAVVSGEAGLSGWLPKWLGHGLDDPYQLAVPLLLMLAAGGAVLIRFARASPRARADTAVGWWVALPSLCAITAWFSTSPEMRYAQPHFWSLAALLATQAIRLRRAISPTRSNRSLLVTGALVGVSPLLISPIVYEDLHLNESPLRTILKANLNRPGTDGLFQPIAGQASLQTYRTRSGLVLNIVSANCWDAPLPCTPNPAPNLRLRDPSDLHRGFVVDGPWQMLNWPNGRQPGFLAAWRKSKLGQRFHQDSLPVPMP